MPPGVRPQYTLAPTVNDRKLISYNSNSSKGNTGLTPEQLAYIANNQSLTIPQQEAIKGSSVGTITAPPGPALGPQVPPGFWEEQAAQQAQAAQTGMERLGAGADVLKNAARSALEGLTTPTPAVGSSGSGGGGSAVDPLQALLDQVNGSISAKYDPQQIAIQNALSALEGNYRQQQDATKTYGDVMSKRNQELYDLFGRQFSDITNQAVGQTDAARQRIDANSLQSNQNTQSGAQALQDYLSAQAQQIGGPGVTMAPVPNRDNGSERSIIDALLTSQVNGLRSTQAALPREAQQMQGNLSETILSKLAGLDQGYNQGVAEQQSQLQQIAAARAGEMQQLIAEAQQQAQAARAASSGGGGSKKASKTPTMIDTIFGPMEITAANALGIAKDIGVNLLTGEPIMPDWLGKQTADIEADSLRSQNDAASMANMAATMAGLEGVDVNTWVANQTKTGGVTAKDAATILEAQRRQAQAPTNPSNYTATQKRILKDIAKYGG